MSDGLAAGASVFQHGATVPWEESKSNATVSFRREPPAGFWPVTVDGVIDAFLKCLELEATADLCYYT